MNIELVIDELVLEGFEGADRRAIAAAIQQELAGLIAAGGPAPGWQREMAIDSLDGGTFALRSGDGPAEIGAQIARKIYGGLL